MQKEERFYFCGIKKGVISEYLPWLLIGIAILVILSITLFILRGSGINLIDKIKLLLNP